MPITKVLVANRGEIARRVFATCRRLGIGTVAVYTTPDAGSPHVAEADARVWVDSYLGIAELVAAAQAAGADAVHPGYGFLSENASFARAVIDAGLTWIGPAPAAVSAMGSKIEAKKMMAAAGVPVLAELDPNDVTSEQLPVLVKASAGGGGRGMRVVDDLADLDEQVSAAQREAQSAFGDATVFCERYLPRGRHIEVQVMADQHGTVWAVGERECSIQRRHQKVIEEAPSPLVEKIPGMRERLFIAARLAAKAIDYTGAGTVEFLADEDGEFYFLEMNTRLQVEHPVTELTTRLDLVELQLMVADGEPLPTELPRTVGHSLEARLYAEDPARGWQPQAGIVHHFEVPGVTTQFGLTHRCVDSSGAVRLDSGIADGSEVSIHYDPMLAKVISYAPTRIRAAQVLADALARTRLHGPSTNRDLLVNVLRHPAFLAGDTDTAFFDTHGLDTLAGPLADDRTVRLSAIAAAIADAARNRVAAATQVGVPSGWRNVVSGNQRKVFATADTEHPVAYRFTRTGLHLPDDPGVALVSATPSEVVLSDDGVATAYAVAKHGDAVWVDSPRGAVAFTAVPRFPDPAAVVQEGSLLAPMPGSVIRLGAAVGDRVVAGQPLVWLEAMKMEHTITAPTDGVLHQLDVTVGQQVEVGAVLARVEPVNTEGDQ